MNKNNIENYGFDEFYKEDFKKIKENNEDIVPGRIIEVQREGSIVISEYGENKAKLKGSLLMEDNKTYLSVGDFVAIKHNFNGVDIIYKILKRKSKFSRLDSAKKLEQIVAVNFDYVFIMSSLNKDFNLKRIERYLSIAWNSGANPVIVLTKADVSEDLEKKRAQVEEIAFGVPVYIISSITGEGLDKIRFLMKPKKTIVFLGSSGVGKSTLVNAIAEKEIMKVNGIREDDSKGRHTTTHRQLIVLDNNAMIIDTPGMREIGMWNVEEGVDKTFSDIKELAKRCKFRNCVHDKEPGCAVKKALEEGRLSEERWKSYLKLQREAVYAEKRNKIIEMSKNKRKRKNK